MVKNARVLTSGAHYKVTLEEGDTIEIYINGQLAQLYGHDAVYTCPVGKECYANLNLAEFTPGEG